MPTSTEQHPTSLAIMRPRSFRWYAAASLVLLSLGIPVLASPLLRYELKEARPGLRRRQNPTVSVTGITAFGVQPRLEIRQLEGDSVMWNLFLLALREFQAIDQNQIDSYYQIAGTACLLFSFNAVCLTLVCDRNPRYVATGYKVAMCRTYIQDSAHRFYLH